MANHLILAVTSIDEIWELPDDLVLKLEEYKTLNPISPDNSNADEIHLAWFDSLTPQQQQKVKRKKADHPSA